MVQQTTVDRLAFNDAAYEALGAPEQVVLLYDRKARVVGIREATEDDTDKSVVTRPATGSPHISVKTFLAWAGLTIGVNRIFAARMELGTLVFEASEPEAVPSKVAGIASFAGKR